MTLTLTQDTEARLRTVAEEQGMDPAQLHEDLLRRALAEAEARRQGAATPPAAGQGTQASEAREQRIRRNQRLIALLDSFEGGDPEQQRQDLEALQAGLEKARPGQRRLFGEGFNP